MQLFATLVGASFRGKAAVALVKGLTPDDASRLSLSPGPENPYDDHAVRVLYDSEHVGYLARENNREIHEALMAGAEPSITLVSVGTAKPTMLIEYDEPDGDEDDRLEVPEYDPHPHDGD